MKALIFVTTCAAMVLLAYGLYLSLSAGRRHLLGRIERHVAGPWRSDAAGDALAQLRAPGRGRSGRVLGGRRSRPRGPLAARLARMLDQAGVALRPGELVWISALAAAGGAALLWALLHNGAALAVGLCAGAVPYLLVGRARHQRRLHLEQRLPDLLMSLVGALRAGHGLLQALQSVAEEIDSPLSAPLRQALAEVGLGTPLETALEHLADRTGSADVDMLVTAILIQRQVGGNLGEILETVGNTTRERVRLRLNLRTLTAQGRLGAIIVALLPPAVGAVCTMISPQLRLILFGQLLGHVDLGLAVLLELTGVLVIRRVVGIRF